MTIRHRRRSGLREQTRTLNGSAVNVNRLRADHLPTSALCKPHWWQERLRSAPTTKCVLAAALLILLTLGAPVHADDPIAQWLKQDESDGLNDQVRPDLHAKPILRSCSDLRTSPELCSRLPNGTRQGEPSLPVWIEHRSSGSEIWISVKLGAAEGA